MRSSEPGIVGDERKRRKHRRLYDELIEKFGPLDLDRGLIRERTAFALRDRTVDRERRCTEREGARGGTISRMLRNRLTGSEFKVRLPSPLTPRKLFLRGTYEGAHEQVIGL